MTSSRTPFSRSVFATRSSESPAATPASTMNSFPCDHAPCPEASAAWTYQTYRPPEINCSSEDGVHDEARPAISRLITGTAPAAISS